MAKNNNTLVFNGLMQGMSWDLIKEAKDEIKRHLGEKLPTRKDILTDWIIGKDYMLQLQGEQYKKGGHLFLGDIDSSINNNWDPDAYSLTKDYLNFMNGISGNNNDSSQNNITMGSGIFEGINSIAAPAVGGLANSFSYNDYWGNSSEVNKSAYGDSTADPIARLLGNISGTGLKRAKDEIENRRQGNVLNLNYGDNASLMAQIEAYNRSKAGLLSQLGDLTVGGGITDFLNSTGLGALHGSTVLPGWGTLGGAILGSASWIGNAIAEGANRKKLNALILDANNDLIRNDLRIAYTVNNNQLLNTFNQLQHTTKNGGHLALEGKLFKSIKNKIADAMQADLNYSDAPSAKAQTAINKLRGYPTGIFGGGNSGGAGISGYWDEVTKVIPETYWVMNTPLPGRSFSDAFAEAVKNNLDTFWFNNKLYNTKRASSEEEYLKNRTKAEYEEPLNLRTVYDKDWNIYLDSTRVEPYIGQLPIIEKKKSKGGKLNKSHKFAEGGLLNNYDYGLEEVNAGGSHEENPNEGVIVSYAPDGLPNKVEEGETIHNDYVYSKRLEANEKVLENNLLDKKYKGKAFADISKKLTEDRKKRPNDPISVRTNEENLNRLQDAQEELKLDNKTREVKRFLGSLNNDLLNALQLEMMDEYEAYAELLAQQLEQEGLAYQEEQAALEGMFGRGGHLKQEGSLIKATEPVRNAEGKIVGWKQPDTSTENVLNLSVYNPNYEGALIYADDRNWFLRNITSPWNTWWNNLPSQEFSWAVRNLTPVGVADAIINGDTEALLEGAFLSGLLGKAKKASKVADKTDDALRLMLEAQLGGNTTKEVTKEATKNSSKWLKSLGIGVGVTGLPLAGFYITDIEKNKDKYDLNALERGRNIGDTIVGDWQFKGDTVINTKTGEKIYSKGGHINLNGGKYDLSRYEAVKALYDLAYSNRYGDNRDYYNYPGFTDDYILQLRAIDKFNTEDTFKLLYKDLYPYLNTKFIETVAPGLLSLEEQPSAIWLPYETLSTTSVPNNTEYNLGFINTNYNPNLENLYLKSPLYKHMLSYELSEPKKEEEQPKVTRKKGTNVKTTNLTLPNTPLLSSTVQEVTNNVLPMDFSPLWMQGDIGLLPRNLFTVENNEELDYSDGLLNTKYLLNQNGIYPEEPEVVAQRAKEREKRELEGKIGLKGNNENSTNYLSYLRYAPILGSLGLVLSDTLGLTNQPDYSNIDMYRRVVDNIGGVNFVPIGGYLQYTPIDKEYIANQQLALAAAYNRSLNNANPVGSYILGLVNDAKVRDQIGNMYINAAAQDLKDKLAVAEYNRGIDITNARNSLAAQLENARLRALRANEYQKIATMRDNERNIAESARAANYDKFITNVGNLGKEEFAFNLVDSNAALLGYYTDRTGRARYRMPAFIKPDGFEAYKQYLKSHGVDESQIDV